MITSVQNEKVKQWKKLQKKKFRDIDQQFLVEGYHLVEEAISSQWNVIEIIAVEDAEIPQNISSLPVTVVTTNVLGAISNTKTPQGIAAVVKMKNNAWKQWKKIICIDQIQDPGNLGAIIRTADAAGFDSIILGDNTVDLYNDKVIRATQGSVFHLDIIHYSLNDAVSKLKKDAVSVWATTLEEATPYNQVTIDEKIAIILGNEGSGVDESLINLADHKVKIPIYGQAESLNVGVAAGILMYRVAEFS
ncbi:TrmH family RNA methyltransferase [Saliterribacillus persicus]|uniref:TrmH family RNA methyltransferase n=1 Tax=Saliterribacillus persicus TaxID=930114 RepID=A0A368XER6_9BACI|nr:RNA methyltransferase [Saliterribacillus persicus]RCW66345.1 TrmH family RNA methyltransferase [Saliterribacillus persicus]